jgi:hypothetical protein
MRDRSIGVHRVFLRSGVLAFTAVCRANSFTPLFIRLILPDERDTAEVSASVPVAKDPEKNLAALRTHEP